MNLIFLVIAPFVGIYFLLKTLIVGRFRIYRDGVSNPKILGKRRIPSSNVDHVSILIATDLPW